MKKLTAGIFATLLAVVSADSAYAAIASSGYVDEKVGEVSQTVTTLSGTVSGHTTQIGTINTNLEKKADKATTLSGYGITDAYTSAKGTALEGRVGAAEGEIDALQTEVDGKQDTLGFTPENVSNKTTTLSGTSTDTQYPSAKAVWDTIQTETEGIASSGDLSALGTRVTTAEGEIDTLQTQMAGKANTADLGDLATLDAVGSAQITDGAVATADIADKAVTEAKLSDTVNASLDKANSALQKTTADAAYAVKALESQVGTVSKENMGTTTATTVVGGVKEAIDAAKAADTKAGSAATAASAAQSAVDTVEATIGGYGDIVTHDVSEFATAAQGTKADTAVQPSAISDMLTKTEAGTTYYTKTSGDALAGRVTTAEGEIDAIQTEMGSMATSETVTNLTGRVTAAEGDIDDLEAAVNNAESGLAATNTIADSALSTAQSAQTTANAALPKATYDNQVGTVSATNMGTTATTVVAAIKEVAGEAAGAQSTASSANTAAGAAQKAAEAAQATANAAIPKPSGECSDPANKCVLTFNNSAYAWEVIERGAAE